MNDNKNTILAIVLSALVLIGWQYFVGMPQEKSRQEQLQVQQQKQGTPTPAQPGQTRAGTRTIRNRRRSPARRPRPRPPRLSTAPRRSRLRRAFRSRPIMCRARSRSRAARIDDLALVRFRETVDPKSPPIVLLSPSGSRRSLLRRIRLDRRRRRRVKVADSATPCGRRTGSGALSVGHPVTLTWDNGEGLEFRRTIAVDDKYLFTVKDEVANKGANPVTLYPYALISRHGTPQTLGYYILHEGLIGVLGDSGLQEFTYKKHRRKEARSTSTSPTAGSASPTNTGRRRCCRTPAAHVKAQFSAGMLGTHQDLPDRLSARRSRRSRRARPRAANARLFAGAKEVTRRQRL